MSYISALLVSLDSRLGELATEISTLEDARAALRTRTLAPPGTGAAENGANRPRPARPAPQTKRPAPTPRPPATDPKPELPVAAVTGSKSNAAKPPQRGSATTTPRKRSVSSLSAEQLERLLAVAGSGLSASAIAEQAGVGYSRVLAQLRRCEASGKGRRTGTRRSTQWLLITDEDRIAQRAAELERLVGARRDERTQPRAQPRAS